MASEPRPELPAESPESRQQHSHGRPVPGLRGIATIYRARRLRDTAFGGDADLFGEPSWDILLDLYAARLEGRDVTILSACVGSGRPPTTALRHLATLQSRGLVERYENPWDRRASFIRLTAKASVTLERWFVRSFPMSLHE